MLVLRRTYPDARDEVTRHRCWRVTCENVSVGAIVHQDSRPDPVWMWSNTVQDPSPGIARSGMAATREEAMIEFREAWDQYRDWLGDERWQRWVEHMAMVEARAGLRRY